MARSRLIFRGFMEWELNAVGRAGRGGAWRGAAASVWCPFPKATSMLRTSALTPISREDEGVEEGGGGACVKNASFPTPHLEVWMWATFQAVC